MTSWRGRTRASKRIPPASNLDSWESSTPLSLLDVSMSMTMDVIKPGLDDVLLYILDSLVHQAVWVRLHRRRPSSYWSARLCRYPIRCTRCPSSPRRSRNSEVFEDGKQSKGRFYSLKRKEVRGQWRLTHISDDHLRAPTRLFVMLLPSI
jgi:hypothetical protein